MQTWPEFLVTDFLAIQSYYLQQHQEIDRLETWRCRKLHLQHPGKNDVFGGFLYCVLDGIGSCQKRLRPPRYPRPHCCSGLTAWAACSFTLEWKSQESMFVLE